MPRLRTLADLAGAAELLRQSSQYRVLQRLPRPFEDVPDELSKGARRVALLDVETTGLDSEIDAIIELCLMHVSLASDGTVLGHSKLFSWCEDPGAPLSPDIVRLTGLRDENLKGQAIDDKAVMAILSRCDLVIAHNAYFDIRFLDKRLPVASHLPWACSLAEIDWAALGYPCRKLEHLVLEHGGFYDAHRAESDVWALFQLLQSQVRERCGEPSSEESETYFGALLASSDAGCVRVRAHGLPFDDKEFAKRRGYSWDAMKRVWFKDMPMGDYLAEKTVFTDAGHPEPTGTMLDAVSRYRV